MQNLYISTNIKTLCKDRKITIKKLIEECKLSKSFIYDLEKRSTSPSCDKIVKIADFLECSVDYLLGRSDSSSVKEKSDILDLEKEEIIKSYNKLNIKGRKKLLDYAHDLTLVESYTEPYILSTVAARSKDNSEPIRQEYVRDLSKIPQDDNIDL